MKNREKKKRKKKVHKSNTETQRLLKTAKKKNKKTYLKKTLADALYVCSSVGGLNKHTERRTAL